jgi:coenzyme F420-dependent glucose-6-phosphate dehydrogenase
MFLEDKAMVEIGYALSSEAHAPNDLIRYMRLAEDAGFAFACLADYYHPWMEQQGQNPFIWSIIGGIAQATQRLRLVIGMTCPTTRMHPSTIAQAVATVAAMMPGRCCLSLETGEYLSERIWRSHDGVPQGRLEMLEEAVKVIRLLWQGGVQSHWGRHYSIENVRIYTPPEEQPAILIAANEWHSAEVAGRIGDGLMSAMPEGQLIQTFELAGGLGKPRYGKVSVCWARNDKEARLTAQALPSAVPSIAALGFRLPGYLAQASGCDGDANVAKFLCSGDPVRHIAAIREFAAAGYDHIYVHHVGPDQEGFIRFYEGKILPGFGS